MTKISHDRLAVGEQHLRARAIHHDPGCRDDWSWPSHLIEDFVADPKVAHKPPAAGTWDGRVDGERLALKPASDVGRQRNDLVGGCQDKLTRVKTKGSSPSVSTRRVRSGCSIEGSMWG